MTPPDGPDLASLSIVDLIRNVVRDELPGAIDRALSTRAAAPKCVSADQYAVARSISVSTVRNAIRNGHLPAIRIGTAIRVSADVEIGRPVAASRELPPSERAARILASSPRRRLPPGGARPQNGNAGAMSA